MKIVDFCIMGVLLLNVAAMGVEALAAQSK